jgi:hypothetical protein
VIGVVIAYLSRLDHHAVCGGFSKPPVPGNFTLAHTSALMDR